MELRLKSSVKSHSICRTNPLILLSLRLGHLDLSCMCSKHVAQPILIALSLISSSGSADNELHSSCCQLLSQSSGMITPGTHQSA